MTVQIYPCRLFGGKDISVLFDNVAQTLTVLGQSILISTLPMALQAEWQAASASTTFFTSISGPRPAFGGSTAGAAVGDILDNQPVWRSAVMAALANFVSEQTLGGQVASVETFNH
jgi:hypothetical protein